MINYVEPIAKLTVSAAIAAWLLRGIFE